VKCRSSLAVYNNEFILGSACVGSENNSDVDELKLRINSEWAALSHAVIEHAVALGEWCQRSTRLRGLAFVLEADILSICCNKDDVM